MRTMEIMTFDEAKTNLAKSDIALYPADLDDSIRVVLAEVERLRADNATLAQVLDNYREGQKGLIELNHKGDVLIAHAAREIEELREENAAILAALIEPMLWPQNLGDFASDLEVLADNEADRKQFGRANTLRAKAAQLRAAIALAGGHITMAEFEQVAASFRAEYRATLAEMGATVAERAVKL